MPYKFRASFVIFRKFLMYEFFKLFVLLEVDGVPELWSTFVHVIDAIEVMIFLVPAEHGLPLADINVRI